jgi:hypothetical protein
MDIFMQTKFNSPWLPRIFRENPVGDDCGALSWFQAWLQVWSWFKSDLGSGPVHAPNG